MKVYVVMCQNEHAGAYWTDIVKVFATEAAALDYVNSNKGDPLTIETWDVE